MRVMSTFSVLAVMCWDLGALPVLAHGGAPEGNGRHRQRSTGDHHRHGAPAPQPRSVRRPRSDGGAFANCTEARAAGRADLRRGEPGHGPHLGRDGDGSACGS